MEEIKRTICDICCPSFHCGIDAYVRDGQIVKIEGTAEHPQNHGLLCAKGLAARQYVYRKDRIQTPLLRVGERGSGEFRPISWEEAYRRIAEHLLKIRAAPKQSYFSPVIPNGIAPGCTALPMSLARLTT